MRTDQDDTSKLSGSPFQPQMAPAASQTGKPANARKPGSYPRPDRWLAKDIDSPDILGRKPSRNEELLQLPQCQLAHSPDYDSPCAALAKRNRRYDRYGNERPKDNPPDPDED